MEIHRLQETFSFHFNCYLNEEKPLFVSAVILIKYLVSRHVIIQ